MKTFKLVVRWFALGFTTTMLTLLLSGCMSTIRLPGGVVYSSPSDIVASNVVITVTSTNGTASVTIGAISASKTAPTDANTRLVEAVSKAVIEGAAAGAK